jgi:DNA adenine methylase
MKFYSPLRYPGGKNKLAKFVALVCEENDINGHYVEPYAGSAAVALYLLLNGFVKEITINDLDKGIFAFWYSILNNTEDFCNKIRKTKISVSNWKKFKKIHSEEKKDLFNLGFATFFLNRTNHSGIIDGGIIGGLDQDGDYKIDCRFNKDSLIERIQTIAKHKAKINLYNLNAVELIDKLTQEGLQENTIYYFDPPYFLKGPSLYLNSYKEDDHKKVSEEIKKMKNTRWIVSYDNVPQIKKLYSEFRKKEYMLSHVAYEVREGKEILFFSQNLTIPRISNPIV